MNILDKFRLNNRVALISGGNRGLGKAIALALAEAGGRVAITSRSLAHAQEVAAGIETSTGQMCRAVAPHFKKQRYGRVINLGSIMSAAYHPSRSCSLA